MKVKFRIIKSENMRYYPLAKIDGESDRFELLSGPIDGYETIEEARKNALRKKKTLIRI